MVVQKILIVSKWIMLETKSVKTSKKHCKALNSEFTSILT